MWALLGQASVFPLQAELCSLDWSSHNRLQVYAKTKSVPRLLSPDSLPLWSPRPLLPQNSHTLQEDPLYHTRPYPHLPATCGPLPAAPGPLQRKRQEGAASW